MDMNKSSTQVSQNYKICHVHDLELDSMKLILGLQYPELKTMYEKTNRLVERISKVIVFVYATVLRPLIIFPAALRSYLIYFTTDLGADAFILPVPMW